MTQPVTWTATTAEEALSLLRAAQGRIDSAMKVAYPGDPATRLNAQSTTEVRLSLVLDTTVLDRLGAERHVFNAQVSGDENAS
ncbi:hypothetical protein [Streptomyces sp. MZ04]|uniref:hypothetical protein n=1 Tax=Streptomyces sp. MZ04 TaxID=2559236 RepID=UPI00107E8097|nr:hypothetical protein [Streptomyces sp. MZ04]TGB06544.1 hypothetical protein E2651_23315 [Streptomyces sp. MZ04]